MRIMCSSDGCVRNDFANYSNITQDLGIWQFRCFSPFLRQAVLLRQGDSAKTTCKPLHGVAKKILSLPCTLKVMDRHWQQLLQFKLYLCLRKSLAAAAAAKKLKKGQTRQFEGKSFIFRDKKSISNRYLGSDLFLTCFFCPRKQNLIRVFSTSAFSEFSQNFERTSIFFLCLKEF